MTVWVVPGASRDEVVGIYGGALRLRVSVPAEGGKANRAAAALAAHTLGGRRGEVVAGHSARRKLVLVRGVGPAEAALRVAAALGRG